MLNKKYYKAIIDIVKRQSILTIDKIVLLEDFAGFLQCDNPNFDIDKFWKYYYKEDNND